MKVDRLNEYVLATTVVVCGVLLAIVCGRLAGTGDNFWLYALAAGIVYLITCLTMRSRVWVLIPMFWSCAGQLNSVPFHLPLRDLVVVGVVVYYCTLKAFKVVRDRATYGWLDVIMGLNLLYIASVYMRYPIGVNVFGTDMVGGRAYLEIIFALGGYWILSQVVMPPRQARIFPLLLCAVTAFMAVVSTITYLFPSTVPILGKLYGGIDAESYMRQQNDSGGDDDQSDMRAEYLSGVGTTLINLMSSYFSPLTFINPMYFWRCLGFLAAALFCMKSGHRITVPGVAATIFLATYFRKGIAAVVIMLLITVPPMAVLIAGQGRLYELPEPVQRTLCMFPGNWDPDVLENAHSSTEWRLQMWDIMLHEDTYIHDKVFGDGFGFSREMMENRAGSTEQEAFMETNEPHSGPVSTIRVVGYVGLGLFVLLLTGCSIRSWRLIKASKGTPFFAACLFVGVQTIYSSIGFIFIFGDFKNDILNMVMCVGLLNLLSRSFAAYRKSIEEPPPAPVLKKTVQPLAPMPMPALH